METPNLKAASSQAEELSANSIQNFLKNIDAQMSNNKQKNSENQRTSHQKSVEKRLNKRKEVIDDYMKTAQPPEADLNDGDSDDAMNEVVVSLTTQFHKRPNGNGKSFHHPATTKKEPNSTLSTSEQPDSLYLSHEQSETTKSLQRYTTGNASSMSISSEYSLSDCVAPMSVYGLTDADVYPENETTEPIKNTKGIAEQAMDEEDPAKGTENEKDPRRKTDSFCTDRSISPTTPSMNTTFMTEVDNTDDEGGNPAAVAPIEIFYPQQVLPKAFPIPKSPRSPRPTGLPRPAPSPANARKIVGGNSVRPSPMMIKSFGVPKGEQWDQLGADESKGANRESPDDVSYSILVHRLKKAEAKNLLLQQRVVEMESQVEESLSGNSGRAKLLLHERNQLEQHKMLLEDDLMSTKEELLFIRSQLQTKSSRISELEVALLSAKRQSSFHLPMLPPPANPIGGDDSPFTVSAAQLQELTNLPAQMILFPPEDIHNNQEPNGTPEKNKLKNGKFGINQIAEYQTDESPDLTAKNTINSLFSDNMEILEQTQKEFEKVRSNYEEAIRENKLLAECLQDSLKERNTINQRCTELQASLQDTSDQNTINELKTSQLENEIQQLKNEKEKISNDLTTAEVQTDSILKIDSASSPPRNSAGVSPLGGPPLSPYPPPTMKAPTVDAAVNTIGLPGEKANGGAILETGIPPPAAVARVDASVIKPRKSSVGFLIIIAILQLIIWMFLLAALFFFFTLIDVNSQSFTCSGSFLDKFIQSWDRWLEQNMDYDSLHRLDSYRITS